jgi:hypothetical protein
VGLAPAGRRKICCTPGAQRRVGDYPYVDARQLAQQPLEQRAALAAPTPRINA